MEDLTQTSTVPKKKKVRLPTFWAVELDNEVFQHPLVSAYLAAHPDIVPLEKIHSTLLYVGNKHDEMVAEIDAIKQHAGKKCILEVDGFGYSETACALSITKMILDDELNTEMPSYPNKHQHVTLALGKGTKAVESVETLVRENRTFCEFPEKLVLIGTVRFMF